MVDVEGGTLAVHELTGSADSPRTVIAAHGITANALSLVALARALPAGIRVLAPDLRGRAESRHIDRPWGIGVHADDLFLEPEVVAAVTRLTVPATMLYASRGMFDQIPGLYGADALSGAGLPESVVVQAVPDCNHYSIVFAPAALAAVVAAIG